MTSLHRVIQTGKFRFEPPRDSKVKSTFERSNNSSVQVHIVSLLLRENICVVTNMTLACMAGLVLLFLSGFPAKGKGTFADQFPQIEAVRSNLNTTVGETVEMEYMYGIPVNSSDSTVLKTIYILKPGRRESVCEVVPNGTRCDGQYQARARLEDKPWDYDDGSSYKRGLLVLTLENVMLSDAAVYEGEVRVFLGGYNQSKVSVTVEDVPWCPYRPCPDGEWLQCQTDTNMTCSCTCRVECTPGFDVGSFFGGVATVVALLLLFLLYKYGDKIRVSYVSPCFVLVSLDLFPLSSGFY
ncbi:uncharacterized protein [Branchiostoma lanceolatum]|uniref:uncharacterized protein isoform X1 n=1 Tax=Branchiostoma lanceolatum TaxID=7740 RepID=UPI0034561622